jgi:outer membrane murein-binding lipoprotein Lpp
MSTNTLLVKSVCRVTASGDTDTLDLKPGVNVIVGDKDTGKSRWLDTISYLLGDTDPPEKGLGPEVAAKFDRATLQMDIGGEGIAVERRWKEHGATHKVFANGDGMSSADFGEYLQRKLDIPTVRYPKGSPLSGYTWPLLSWRELFRHVYREERFWSDLADKQMPKVQHACLLQFLGAADKMYPKEREDAVNERQNLTKLQARKEQFDSVLQQAAKDLIPDPAINTAPTLDAIDRGVERLRAEAEQLRQRRKAVLDQVLAARPRDQPQLVDTALADRRVQLSVQRERDRAEFEKVVGRAQELRSYREAVKSELSRLKRADAASDLLAELKVTQCPVCDRKVTPAKGPSCYLCHNPVAGLGDGEHTGAKRRIAFEAEQLEGEEAELRELLGRLEQEQRTITDRVRRLDEELAEVETRLRPVRTAFVALIPPEITTIDTQIGQLEEKAAQLLRLRLTVLHRDELAAEIDKLRAKVESLKGDVDAEAAKVPFEKLSDDISDGINEYLNLLNEGDKTRWPHGPVRLDLSETSFKIRVGEKWWTSVGNTSAGILLLGYHYSLLKLSGRDGCNYPGLALIDFPMTFADGMTISDKENYLIDPFVTLFRKHQKFQLVVCGRSFQNLQGVNRITLTTVWKQNQAEGSAPPLESGPDDNDAKPDGPPSAPPAD